MKSTKYWIKHLKLQKHQEGGYFREIHRSSRKADFGKENFPPDGLRNIYTSIYFLITDKYFSAFHKLQTDEIWHFYYGSTAGIYMIESNGNLKIIKIGPEPEKDEQLQLLVPSETWMAAKPENSGSYTLCGTTMSPGYDPIDFEMAKQDELISKFPKHRKIIKDLTY